MFDREAILAAVDLRVLADELLGAGRGSMRSAMWRCPNRGHVQTGRTPPVGVFMSRTGEPRWHCHGCGIGGTAVDLVMHVRGVSVRAALEELAARTGIGEVDPERWQASRCRREGPAPLVPYVSPRAVPGLDSYVSQCAEVLWRSEGEAVRRWLTEARGLPEDVLRVNRIGADLGFRRQERPSMVPKVLRAVVLPVVVPDGACFVQLRVLNGGPDFPRYLNSLEAEAPNPRVGFYRPGRSFDLPVERNELIITEGVIDALSATAAGYEAAAVLGAGLADPVTALALARVPKPLVVAFDPDAAGRHGTDKLVQQLEARHRRPHILQLRDGDLNENLVRATEWPLEIAARVGMAVHRRSPPAPIRRTG